MQLHAEVTSGSSCTTYQAKGLIVVSSHFLLTFNDKHMMFIFLEETTLE